MTQESGARKRNYIMLVAMARQNSQLLQDALVRIRREIDAHASPAWLDGVAAAIFVSTDLKAKDVLGCILPGNPTHEQRQAVRDVTVMELGSDFYGADTSTKAMAWLNSHRLPPPMA